MDHAWGEIAKALVETDRSLSLLHALQTVVAERAYRRCYRDGVLDVAWLCRALAE